MADYRQQFIEQMMPHAMEASRRTGVDPRIILGQAAIESNYGKSAPGNNYFGIKSVGQQPGQVLATKEVGPQGELIPKCEDDVKRIQCETVKKGVWSLQGECENNGCGWGICCNQFGTGNVSSCQLSRNGKLAGWNNGSNPSLVCGLMSKTPCWELFSLTLNTLIFLLGVFDNDPLPQIYLCFLRYF